MTSPALIERITRSLAYMLRHQPEKFDLELDAFGYGEVDEVVRALNERLGEPVDREDLVTAIDSGDRPRYEIAGEKIRALYGHSIDVEPGEPANPPELLYVGISSRDAERALRNGLRGGRRRFLHLALSVDDAKESGRRTGREYSVVCVHALDAWEEGTNFYDRKSLFLAEQIPTDFLELQEECDDGYERPRFETERERPRRGGSHRDGGRPDRGGRREERGGRREEHRGGRPRELEAVGAPSSSEGRQHGGPGDLPGRGRGDRDRQRGGRDQERGRMRGGEDDSRAPRESGGREESRDREPAAPRPAPSRPAPVERKPSAPAQPSRPAAVSPSPQPSFGTGVFQREGEPVKELRSPKPRPAAKPEAKPRAPDESPPPSPGGPGGPGGQGGFGAGV
jgi:putative RNA 2'-phosphotransferase